MTGVAVIVQARSRSTRLPGKVLLPLAGRTVLDHVLARCRAVPGADRVVCAVPEGAGDDAVAAEALRCGVVVVRGPEADVLERYRRAALAVAADEIVRVTSDCPLIDPALCGAVLALRRAEGADYACNNLPPSWPHGLDCEAFTLAALERAGRESADLAEREHVTTRLREQPGYRVVNLPCPQPGLAGHRWTLDYAADFAFFEALFARLPAIDRAWTMTELLAVLEAHPEIAAINAGHADHGASRLPRPAAAEPG